MLLGRSTWIWLAGGGLFAAMAAAALYVAWPLLNPQIVATAPLDPQCDLRRGACTARLPDGGEVRLELDPKTLPLLEPLRIAVDVEGLRALGVEVDFAGVDMNMGYNRPALAAEERAGSSAPRCCRCACATGWTGRRGCSCARRRGGRRALPLLDLPQSAVGWVERSEAQQVDRDALSLGFATAQPKPTGLLDVQNAPVAAPSRPR